MAAQALLNPLREVAHITKFNGENHHEWKYEVLSILEQLGLKDLLAVPTGQIINGTLFSLNLQRIDEDGVILNHDEINIWKQRDVTCRNIILATSEPNQKQNLYGLETAKEMWDAIAAQYAARAEDLIILT